MFKDFITWLYARYVVAPEFKEYLKEQSQVIFFRHHDRTNPTIITYDDEVSKAMFEKRFAPRVDH